MTDSLLALYATSHLIHLAMYSVLKLMISNARMYSKHLTSFGTKCTIGILFLMNTGIANDNSKLIRGSDNLITSCEFALDKKTIRILDLGCGGGHGFKSIVELNQPAFASLSHIHYVKVDLIDLDEAKKNIDSLIQATLPNVSFSIERRYEHFSLKMSLILLSHSDLYITPHL